MVQSSAQESKLAPLAVSVTEAARLLGISRSQAWNLVKTGDLPSVMIGTGRRVVAMETLRKMLAAS